MADIDVTHQLTAVHRAVGDRDTDQGEMHVVTISQAYDSPIEDVWDAVTNPERIPRWFLPVTGELKVGGTYQLEGNAGGTVESCDPPYRFSATWEYDGISWIEVRLSAESGDRTRVELDHIAPGGDHWDQFGPGAAGVGWDMGLMALSLHLTTGSDKPASQDLAWMASADGLEFVRGSGRMWGDAHIAGGADEATANAMAERTITAYTTMPDAPSS